MDKIMLIVEFVWSVVTIFVLPYFITRIIKKWNTKQGMYWDFCGIIVMIIYLIVMLK